ncbi:hypothetical protein FQN57_001691 [Myotisia sp. PD_48]|nr:hypothetical protein FQN57_001691 [Myotisia sp. PD_48]
MASDSSAVVLQGGCNCGKIRYTATSLPEYMCHCTCITCRKASGSAYLACAGFPRASVTWVNSPPKYYISSTFAKRGFCGDCGSTLTYEMNERPGRITLCAGTIDDWEAKGDIVKPAHYSYLGEKAVWFDVPDDGLVRYEGDDE